MILSYMQTCFFFFLIVLDNIHISPFLRVLRLQGNYTLSNFALFKILKNKVKVTPFFKISHDYIYSPLSWIQPLGKEDPLQTFHFLPLKNKSDKHSQKVEINPAKQTHISLM